MWIKSFSVAAEWGPGFLSASRSPGQNLDSEIRKMRPSETRVSEIMSFPHYW